MQVSKYLVDTLYLHFYGTKIDDSRSLLDDLSSSLPISRKRPALETPRGRICWRLAPRRALFLHPVTPTRAGFSQAGGAYIGASPLGKLCFSVRQRQQGPDFPGLTAPLLALCSRKRLVSPSANANRVRFFPSWRRLCWRLAPREALFLRPPTPTRAAFSPADGALVGALLPAKPCFFIRSRQHEPVFPGLPVSLLAPCSPQSLCPSSGHANRPPRIHSPAAGALVGALLPGIVCAASLGNKKACTRAAISSLR